MDDEFPSNFPQKTNKEQVFLSLPFLAKEFRERDPQPLQGGPLHFTADGYFPEPTI